MLPLHGARQRLLNIRFTNEKILTDYFFYGCVITKSRFTNRLRLLLLEEVHSCI